MSKRILIAGGAGFIGSNLCKKLLLKPDNQVICVDNLSTGNRANIESFFNYKNFKFINHDVINELFLEVDEIYNLACPASPVHYQKNPVNTFKTSIIGTLNLLEIAKKNNAKFLQASTSEIYGDPLVHPQKEFYFGNVNPIGIRSCYDEGKRAAETVICDYNRTYNVKTKIVRIFNTYGKNMAINDGRVVSNFIVQAILNKNITIYGSGEQTRSFCYVDDLVNGLTKMMDSPDNFIGPVNLGNPEERTILNLAEIIIKLSNSSSKITFKDLPLDDPTRRKPDVTLANQKLHWQPCVSITDGLNLTIEYFRELLKHTEICCVR